MSKERNIREVFGADYLLNSPPMPSSFSQQAVLPTDAIAFGAPAPAPSLIEQAKQTKRIMQMRDVLARLQATNGRSKLHIVLEQPTCMNIDLSELLAVAVELEKGRLIQVIDKDRFGNWEVEITPAGREFLTAMAF